ncbi:hypothetical protein ACIRD3_40305 [Kitasatospora sp. NPDC093550]|uniref:hypothetical protein n=1 Tax=Kitasatospora sp. NPDC093550 TaxID=3364089 RepID=UPI00380F349B
MNTNPRKAAAVIALSAAAAFTLTACGNDVEHGTVIEKHFTPDSYSVVSVPSTTCTNGRCTTTSHLTTVYTPEHWTLVLRDRKGHTGSVDVSAKKYGSVKVGDQY